MNWYEMIKVSLIIALIVGVPVGIILGIIEENKRR